MQTLLINNVRNIAVMLLQTRESIEADATLGPALRIAVCAVRYQLGLLDAVLGEKGSR